MRENTHAQRKKGQVQHFTTSSGWHKRHPHLGCVHLTAWGWSFLLFFVLATLWTSPDGVFWMVAVAVLPKMSSARIACSPKYMSSFSSKSYKSSFACGAHARWKVPLWFPLNMHAAVTASPFFFLMKFLDLTCWHMHYRVGGGGEGGVSCVCFAFFFFFNFPYSPKGKWLEMF